MEKFNSLKRTWNREKDRQYLPFAALQATMANLQRDPEQHPDPFTPYNFMIWNEPPPKIVEKRHKEVDPNAAARRHTKELIAAQRDALERRTVLVPKTDA